MSLDLPQLLIWQKLQQISDDLKSWHAQSFFKKIFSSKKNYKSLYIYGGVGRGKSMLMKNFFSSLNKIPKIYFHFNSFMRLLHENLHQIRKENKKYRDELIEAIRRIIKDSEVICFDEFQVLDIADAMLLSRIFSYIFAKEILVIFTSNSAPRELYKNGLQREVFLEFVEKVLLKNCEVLLLENNIDYRALYRQNLSKRYFISNEKNRELIKEIIANFTDNNKPQVATLKVWGREVKIKKTFGKIAVINFAEICENNLAASDYQVICENFDLIFLLKIPQLKKEDINQAKRFILFIDEVYENKTALIMMAKTAPEKIYPLEDMEAFARTISRINEIKSDAYWRESRIGSN